MATATLVTGRLVMVYEDPWPSGVITGYPDAGGIVVEAVVAFRRGVLLRMLAEGKRLAATQGYTHLRLRLPKAFPLTPSLRRLAQRVGFTAYHEDQEWEDYVWWA